MDTPNSFISPPRRPERAGSNDTILPFYKKHTLRKRVLLLFAVGILSIGFLAGWQTMRGTTASLVPQTVRKAVDFPVYYPNDLPDGYALAIQSFQVPDPGVVLFKVTKANGQEIVFSEQRQPSGSDIDKFVSAYMPLNSVLQLPLGQAKVGAYGSAPNIRTVLSLPIRDGPWLIVTAPADVTHDELTTILSTLTK